ncbi:MAG: CoA-binding protein [Caldilineaceae bacterium]|nr:CoA-binding protein [Caldilineaceae bacterium]MCB0095695.1 CoA-binding protein [Caldilineaceae bacterium]MCB0144650.1 CoA-binding protein [Caldilineaceae bacterium]
MGLGSSPERDRLASDITMNSQLTPEQQRQYQDPSLVRKILTETKTIAMVGLSPNPQRPSYFVASYLQYEGYRVIPVNPRADEILGEKAYPDLRSVPIEIDLVDVFRRPEECVEIAKQAIAIGAKSIWFQLLVINLEAAQLAQNAGLQVIVDRCIKMEHGRYNGSLHWVGMNTELISARKAQRYF